MADLEQPVGFWAKFKHLFVRRRTPPPASRSLLRPWRRNDPAAAQFQKDLESLMQIMLALRDHLEQQSRQQQELSQHLVKLSETDASFPETTRTPEEAVRAIAQQMVYQSQQQNRVGNILEKISDAAGQQERMLQSLADRLESIEHAGQIVGENMQSMGIVMQSVNRNSEQNAQNMTAIRQHTEHQTQMHELNRRQNGRLMFLLVIILILAVAALIAVIVVGWMILRRQQVAI